MGGWNKKVKKIDDFYDIAENALDVKERNREITMTDAIGQSMRPTILSGDRIIIDSSKTDELKTGDIIVFDKGGLLICHRIKEINERGSRKVFITIGDSYEKQDRLEVETHEIAGKVMRIIRRGRFFYVTFYFKSALKRILNFFGIYNISKEIFFRIVRKKLEYRFSLPRKQNSHPAYKFVDIMLDDISGREKNFFAPLNSIGRFRITVYLGKKIVAAAEVYKLPEKEKSNNLWRVTNFYSTGMFSKTRLAEDILKTCRFILARIDVKEMQITPYLTKMGSINGR